MFGSSGKTPQQKQRPLGIDEVKASTNEEARPVVYFAGKQRFACTFISDVFKQKAVGVTQSVGKQKSKVGYNYYASFAACACHGPVDGLHDIFLNGDSVYASSVKLQALSLTQTGGVATFTTKNAHGVADGSQVIIEGAEQLDYNGTTTVTVTSPTVFTFPVPSLPSSPATGKVTARIKLDPIFRDGSNPISVSVLIPDYGTMKLYWGTEEQDTDPLLTSSGSAHPAYRGICYAVFDTLFLGFNQTNVPNLEFVLSRKPTAAWHDLDLIDGEANPLAAACELVQHPRAGFGISDDRLSTAAILEAAGILDDEGFGISPFFNRQQEARQSLLEILEHIGGYPTTDVQGRLSLTLARKPTGALVELTDDDISEFVNFKPQDYESCFTETELHSVNRDKAFKEDSLTWRDTFLFRIIGEPSKTSVERPFITSRRVAQAVINSIGRSNALPAMTGTANVRDSGTLYNDLAPGSMFKFNLSNRSLSSLVFRVSERTLKNSGDSEFEISFGIERSYLFEFPGNPALVDEMIGVGGDLLEGIGGEQIEGV